MFAIKDKHIYMNRGDALTLTLTLKNSTFAAGDKIKINIVKENDYTDVVFSKTFTVASESSSYAITLTSDETRIGNPIKTGYVTYWYEIELNGKTTLIGYDQDGAKQFVLYPEAGEAE